MLRSHWWSSTVDTSPHSTTWHECWGLMIYVSHSMRGLTVTISVSTPQVSQLPYQSWHLTRLCSTPQQSLNTSITISQHLNDTSKTILQHLNDTWIPQQCLHTLQSAPLIHFSMGVTLEWLHTWCGAIQVERALLCATPQCLAWRHVKGVLNHLYELGTGMTYVLIQSAKSPMSCAHTANCTWGGTESWDYL